MTMAALVRFSWLMKTGQQISNKSIFQCTRKCFYSQQKTNIKTGQKIDSMAKSLASKGYLRSQKPYEPPINVPEKIKQICTNLKLNTSTALSLNSKFMVLSKCATEFQHSVPNSMLHELNSIDKIVVFYETPVDMTLPLDAMKTMDLPENLHIQTEPVRFIPETDTMFNGQTAFPCSSTIVTGLKARKKYKGHEVKRSWP